MNRYVACLLVTVLAYAGVVPVGDAPRANQLIAYAAENAAEQSRESAAGVAKPIHQAISFNDYQVVGLNANGWNWVRNDEFILPANTPLEIDILQKTYAKKTGAINRKKVFLDGTELVEYRSGINSPQLVLPWQVPRFSIPAAMLTAGSHSLTFVVEDGLGQSSTVNVSFLVEQASGISIYQGSDATGSLIPSGSTQTIYAENGSMKLYAGQQGIWKVFAKGSTTELKSSYGLRYNTGTLATGSYELSYTPLQEGAAEWRMNLEIGLPPIYQMVNGNKQKIAPGQKIMAASAPIIIPLTADTPGRWYVNGTNQAAFNTQNFEVMLPETLRGMTVTAYYQPEGHNDSNPSKVQIDVPAGENAANNACDPGKARASMDILSRANNASDLETEKVDLKSTTSTVNIYQDPLHEIWVATSADHMKDGSEADADEGPGIWAVNNIVVDAARLNWDHTALDIASFGAGTYNIKYISKNDPSIRWCGSVRVYEDKPPVLASLSCDVDEYGPSPQLMPIQLSTGKGKQLADNGSIEVRSLSSLADFAELTMKANHVANYGTKRIKKGSKSNRSYLTVPDLRWEYDVNEFGEKHDYGGNIFSENKVEILFNEEVIKTIRPRSTRESEENTGSKTLDLQAIIKENGFKAGTYTVRITNQLAHNECRIDRRHEVDDKEIDRVEQKQIFTTSIVVQE